MRGGGCRFGIIQVSKGDAVKKARIIGTGSYLPEKVLTNFDLEKMVDTNNEWITARTGIKERRIAAEGELTSDLAVNAAKRALEMANVGVEEIDLIIVGTITGDFLGRQRPVWFKINSVLIMRRHGMCLLPAVVLFMPWLQRLSILSAVMLKKRW